jgi:hypothetical protein
MKEEMRHRGRIKPDLYHLFQDEKEVKRREVGMLVKYALFNLPVSLFSKRVARSPLRFKAWMDRANVIEVEVPPEEVIADFDNFYRLGEVPSGLSQVGILCLDLSHS